MIRCTPSRDEVLAWDGPERFVALSVSLLADIETPISVFLKLAAGRLGQARLIDNMLLELSGRDRQTGT